VSYNGKNGKTYVAYQGQVYDVSGSYLWKNGVHKGHSAGKDLTYELNSSPHGPGILKGYPVVGTLKK
jgi:predicted heme/steroid binding protein